MRFNAGCSLEFRNWLSNLPPAKKVIVTQLITRARNTPDDRNHYVFPKFSDRPCHAVLEINGEREKTYLMYESYQERIWLLGSGLCFAIGDKFVFDFEIHERDDLVKLGGMPPW